MLVVCEIEVKHQWLRFIPEVPKRFCRIIYKDRQKKKYYGRRKLERKGAWERKSQFIFELKT